MQTYKHTGIHIFKLTNNKDSIILKRKIKSSFLEEKTKCLDSLFEIGKGRGVTNIK